MFIEKQDVLYYKDISTMKQGSILAGHDYVESGIQRAVQELLGNREIHVVASHTTYWTQI